MMYPVRLRYQIVSYKKRGQCKKYIKVNVKEIEHLKLKCTSVCVIDVSRLLRRR